MLKSKDGLIHVDQAADLSSIVFPPASWSVVNLAVESAEAQSMFKNLYNTATSRHVCLALCRHRRKDRLEATGNIREAKNWTYLDTVSLFYEKPSTCSNNGLLPISEPGFLLYKGATPDAKRTAWFGQDVTNATNMWNLATQEEESETYSYYQRFSWEANMILMSLSGPLEHARFIYGMPLSGSDRESIFRFCHHFTIGVQLYVKTHEEAESVINDYEIFLKEIGK